MIEQFLKTSDCFYECEFTKNSENSRNNLKAVAVQCLFFSLMLSSSTQEYFHILIRIVQQRMGIITMSPHPK